MPTDSAECTCWLAPSTKGEGTRSAWLARHDYVELLTIDGQRIRGWPWGLQPSSEQSSAGWTIEDDHGDVTFTPLSDVAAIDPVPSDVNETNMFNALHDAIAHPDDVPTDGLHFELLVGPHESIEVTLQSKQWPCQPAHKPPEDHEAHKLDQLMTIRLL